MCLVLQICTVNSLYIYLFIGWTEQEGSQIADLQENLKTQQAEASKAKEELTRALGTMEKLKEGFNKERADWTTEKSALAQRAEKAEAALKPVVDELTGLKRQINAMTSAVFGKYLLVQFA